jgi:hypothetical protein
LIADPQDLSVDDLLAPLPETISLGGTGPFVINLRASSAPISFPTIDIAGRRHAFMYRIQRIEDGRMRYRLRLGPFVREDEADAVLLRVRNDYPSALTATASAEDLSAIATMQAKAGITPLSVEDEPARAAHVTGIAADTPPGLSTATVSSAEQFVGDSTRCAPPISMASPAPAVSQLLPVLVEHLELMPDPEFSPPARNAPPGDAGIDAMSAPLSLEAPRPEAPDPAVELTLELVDSGPDAPPDILEFVDSEPDSPPGIAAATALSPQQSKSFRETARSLETTQTLRPLTSLELEDDGAARWYVIQLSLAHHAFDPATVPNLDIFSLYTLYSVAGADQGRVMHALRLGFFGEEMAARAVANYLTTYYDKSIVKQVSAAERERFTNQRLDARKDVGETGQHSTIEITSMRAVPKEQVARPAAVAATSTSRQMTGQPAKRSRPAGLFASLPWVKRRS